MDVKKELKILFWIVAIFLGFYFLPVGRPAFDGAVIEALKLTKWYAQEHVLLCLIPAFFIAGAISVFVSQNSVMKYLGAKANKFLAYTVASVSGTILAVCSCTILPLFAGIYKMGAGLGPACAFLYSGPAINVLAIILTARVLGFELGLARTICAIIFAVVIGLIMQFIYRNEKLPEAPKQAQIAEEKTRPLWQTAIFFATMVGLLVFLNFANPQGTNGIAEILFAQKWNISFTLGIALILMITRLTKYEKSEWVKVSWDFAKKILPLLLFGVLVSGFLLGTPEGAGIIPKEWIAGLVGGNSLLSNFIASFVGAFMYFATLTEIPILQGLINAGMGKGPALALLLAGPALSLPNMLVIRSVMGTQKTMVFVSLVVIMATFCGWIFGML
ncbi:MAG: permease [Fusobacterium sp.]|nr:permease [Fusobacterium sp.]